MNQSISTDVNNSRDPDLWAGQAGFAVEYRQGNLYANFDTRYQWTESARFYRANDKKEDMDNLLTTFKIGYNF